MLGPSTPRYEAIGLTSTNLLLRALLPEGPVTRTPSVLVVKHVSQCQSPLVAAV